MVQYPVSDSPVRYQEYEADAIGARIMARAGFDPASGTLFHFIGSCSQVRPEMHKAPHPYMQQHIVGNIHDQIPPYNGTAFV